MPPRSHHRRSGSGAGGNTEQTIPDLSIHSGSGASLVHVLVQDPPRPRCLRAANSGALISSRSLDPEVLPQKEVQVSVENAARKEIYAKQASKGPVGGTEGGSEGGTDEDRGAG